MGLFLALWVLCRTGSGTPKVRGCFFVSDFVSLSRVSVWLQPRSGVSSRAEPRGGRHRGAERRGEAGVHRVVSDFLARSPAIYALALALLGTP